MFGFSLGKILLLTVIIVAVVLVFRRLQPRPTAITPAESPPPGAPRAEALESCPVCQVYATPGRRHCGRRDCPFLDPR